MEVSVSQENKARRLLKKIGENSEQTKKTRGTFACNFRVAVDVWEKDVWEFQAKSGSSGSCRLFLHFLGKIAVQEMSRGTPGSPRDPSSRHPRNFRFFSDLRITIIGRLANGYFVNGYFEFPRARETHIFRELACRLFLPEGSSLFPPFLSLRGSLLATYHGFSKYPFAKYPVCELLNHEALALSSFRGGDNSDFVKRWFRLGDTRHFRRFPGFEKQNPSFLWVECNIRMFANFFLKTACFRQGTKRPFSKTTVSTTLIIGSSPSFLPPGSL